MVTYSTEYLNKLKEEIRILEQKIEKSKNEEIESVFSKLDVTIDELGYALRKDKHESNKEFYINNAIRFINEVKEDIHKLVKGKDEYCDE